MPWVRPALQLVLLLSWSCRGLTSSLGALVCLQTPPNCSSTCIRGILAHVVGPCLGGSSLLRLHAGPQAAVLLCRCCCLHSPISGLLGICTLICTLLCKLNPFYAHWWGLLVRQTPFGAPCGFPSPCSRCATAAACAVSFPAANTCSPVYHCSAGVDCPVHSLAPCLRTRRRLGPHAWL